MEYDFTTERQPLAYDQHREEKPPKLAHKISSAADRLDTNPRRVASLIASGELKSFKLGRQRLIPDAELERLIEKKMREAA